VLISIIFFKEVGFIIIPIATTASSWFNAILLFIFLKMNNLFSFNLVFINRFIRILLASVLMGIFFNYVMYLFNDKLIYEASFKAVYLIGTVIMGLIFYLLIAILIKAFKRSDINLSY
jgi:putative peptidoglycan lipid II flippase